VDGRLAANGGRNAHFRGFTEQVCQGALDIGRSRVSLDFWQLGGHFVELLSRQVARQVHRVDMRRLHVWLLA